MLDRARELSPPATLGISLPGEHATSLNRSASSPLNTVEGLNKGCFCRTLNAERLREQLESDASLAGLAHAGQTTNFRTPGGGFAPVVVVP